MMSFTDELWLQNNLKENHIKKEKVEPRMEKTRNQKLGLGDNTAAIVGLVFIIAFLALIITT